MHITPALLQLSLTVLVVVLKRIALRNDVEGKSGSFAAWFFMGTGLALTWKTHVQKHVTRT